MYRKEETKIGSFISSTIPREGEIIKFKSVNYEVVKVIRIIESELQCEKFIIQVIEHNPIKLIRYSSRSWEENIPLCVDIKED